MDISSKLNLKETYRKPIEDIWVSKLPQVVKNLPASVGDTRDAGSIPGSVRSPSAGNGNPLQHSCLENPMDRGAWWAIVQGVTESQI